MFLSGMKESSESRIHLKEINGDILHALIDYFYSGTIEINMDIASELLSAASLLQLQSITDECVDYLIKHLESVNALWLKALGDLYNLKKLSEAGKKSALKNFSKIKHSDEFLNLTINEVVNYLSDEYLNASKEDVFNAAIEWINFDKAERNNNSLQLLKCIRYSEMDASVRFSFYF